MERKYEVVMEIASPAAMFTRVDTGAASGEALVKMDFWELKKKVWVES